MAVSYGVRTIATAIPVTSGWWSITAAYSVMGGRGEPLASSYVHRTTCRLPEDDRRRAPSLNAVLVWYGTAYLHQHADAGSVRQRWRAPGGLLSQFGRIDEHYDIAPHVARETKHDWRRSADGISTGPSCPGAQWGGLRGSVDPRRLLVELGDVFVDYRLNGRVDWWEDSNHDRVGDLVDRAGSGSVRPWP